MNSPVRHSLYGLIFCSLLLPSLALSQDAADVTLINHHGEDFTLASLRGNVVLLVFGVTNCPHICPVEMSRASTAMEGLERYGERVRAVFITVDPQRDTPEVIAAYLSNFHPGFIGLTGTQAALDTVADHYRVKRTKTEVTGKGPYTLDHGYSLYILNQYGEAQMTVLPGLPPGHVVSMVENLLANDSTTPGENNVTARP